ncbi:MAG: hypothetical protein HC912_07360 [Saprospiraceae bacterium]|nr:hypothetical protein [Saprospiraceae bacterium]
MLLSLGACFSLKAQIADSKLVNGKEERFSTKGVESIPAEMVYQFKNDAARLALRSLGDPSHQPILIPEDLTQSYFNILINIYTHDDVAKSIANCHIHTASSPSTDYLKIIYERTVDWASPLRKGITSTDSKIINNLIEQYDLLIERNEYFDARRDAIVLRAIKPINMTAIANELYPVEAVELIELGHDRNQDTDISIQTNDEGWQVRYLISFREEKSVQQHYWFYEVKWTGQVTLLSEGGAPIPEHLQCY